ncbi:acyl-CoA dehydrogenase [Brevirhabdus pacifica]|uniref:Acyl-CoA dehydrogenase n=1 Tax=Brevirhabdus pacifica TaxID=1267768 RepID=A0A1U7DLB1_9RHOB|nr:acyl-CoA dehydrogenase [Brevirhabdus pacifica]APX90784.1 acyl-CoA dehydrogenase [Brevirhabdus pacifica]OWU79568.1 acyl-CoA dehydrogenase [Loktanella sp. 22II-4b]PJJ87336.1 alkylation response protein AidB-like acyl-CoA dehydrogenase [Brevirhabdus pacifica]
MDFDVSEDRRMLADSLNRFLADRYGIEHRNSVAYDAPYHDPDRWSEMVELGVLHALVPEEAGGFGGTGFDITVVFEALGRALNPEPVLAALISARLLVAAGRDVEDLVTGTSRYAAALSEPDAPYEVEDIATEATADGDGWRLSGRKSVVYGGHLADRFLVSARHGDGIGLFAVNADAARVTPYGMIDGGGAAEVFLDSAPAELLMTDAVAAIGDALDAGALALCAEAVGAMDVTRDTLLDYLRQRKQFGRTIGSFQALQHRAVELAAEIEQARSITILAASRLGGDGGSRTVSMAKNLVGRTARLVSEETIQMHGGIAMTWEYSASHYAKRLVMLDHQLGDTDHHLERVMAAYAA